MIINSFEVDSKMYSMWIELSRLALSVFLHENDYDDIPNWTEAEVQAFDD